MAPLLQVHPPEHAESLVLKHRHMARRLAQRYVRGADSREDLEQVAYLGLVKAAHRFEPDHGVAFTTFALPMVLGELRRFCRDSRWAVHVPRGVQERVLALWSAEAANQRPMTVSEAAGRLGWSEEDVVEARLAGAGWSAQSLNVALPSQDDGLGEAIDAMGAEDPGFQDAEHRDELDRALAKLTEPERQTLLLRGEAGCSTPEIARRMGLTPAQAAGLTDRALTRLRQALDGDVAAQHDEPVAAEPESAVARADAINALAGALVFSARQPVEERLLTLFAAVGARWGRPTTSGTAIALPLTPELLARSIDTRPPEVRRALRRLSRCGRLRRAGRQGWLLADAPGASRRTGTTHRVS